MSRWARRMILIALLTRGAGFGGELILPAPAMERSGIVTLLYKVGLQATGKGELKIHWTDACRRTVEDRTIPVTLTDENELRFPLDMGKAVAMENEIRVHFTFDGLNKKGEKDHRDEEASVKFIAKPPDRTWWDYQNIMWQGGSAEHFKALEKVGVNAGKSSEHSMVLPEMLLQDDLRWYVENIATDFYSAYHIYRPDRPYNYALLQAKALYRKDPNSNEGLKRNPSLSDPHWLTLVHDRLVRAAQTYSPYRPIFYNLADEAGIAELAGFWDFDFSDYSLGTMREWLKEQYGTLSALNKQWGTNFSSWDAVTPETTREAIKRTDDNYSSWADHKEWMDISFASALKMGADAVREVDPQAYVGIEGAQMPGWGGYDYARISPVLQAIEPYDIGDNVEIIRSINPHIAFVTTSFAQGPWEKHRVWFELLHGSRGQIIWDEKSDIVEPDGTLGQRGKDVDSYWNEIRNGIGALLINSQRQSGPVAIHYSQASMRTDWMLRQRSEGDAWMDRLSSTERKDSEFLRIRDSYCRLIEDQGLQYKFVAYGQVAQGELLKGGYRVLILPWSNSLSAQEARAITSFVRQGGVLIVDGEAGTFDEHSRRLPESSLAAILGGATGRGQVIRMNALNYHQQRVLGTEEPAHRAMEAILAKAGVRPEFAAVDKQGQPMVGIETHEFRNGGLTLIGLHNNPQQSVNELGPPEMRSNKRFEKPQTVTLLAPVEQYAYDVRAGKELGRKKQLSLTVDPYQPTIIAFSPTRLPALNVTAPAKVARGEIARLAISLRGTTSAAVHVLHLNVTNPAGEMVRYHSGNLFAPGGSAEKSLPMAVDAPAGKWSVSVRDLLSGQEQSTSFEVY